MDDASGPVDSWDDVDTPDRLPRPLAYVAEQVRREDVPIHQWLSLMVARPQEVCLQCRTEGGDMFFTWNSEKNGVTEVLRTDGGLVLGPEDSGVVRTAAVIDGAGTVNLKHRSETPVAWTT